MKNVIETYFRGNYLPFYSKYLSGLKHIGGNEYQALCPFHDDNNPSLNVNIEKGAYFCHGCGKKGSAFHFFAKLNELDDRKDFPKILKRIADDFGIHCEETQRRLVKAYDYRDEKGNLLFQVCRFDPKGFAQRRPNGNGQWKYDLRGVQTVLYRLPDLINADEVILVEGEKDADRLHELGFCGTTSPMGAKKFKAEYVDALSGKDVFLIPDNDNDGREHMALAASLLKNKVRSLKWLDLPGIPSKGDLSDFADRFTSREECVEALSLLIEKAAPYEPPKVTTIDDVILDSAAFQTISLPEKQTLVHPIVCEQQIILVPGSRGIGKSWFGISLLDAVSRGIPFCCWQVINSVPCLYLDGEMAATDTRKRFLDLNPAEERKAPLYIYSDAYANHLGLPRASLINERWRSEMKRILTTRHIKLWVVDNISSLSPGLDENKKMDWDQINQWLLELRFAGITTILLHHTNKEGGQRGTSGREDNVDMTIMLKRPQDYEAENGVDFIISFTKSRVPFEYLHLLQEQRFTMKPNITGRLEITCNSVKAELRESVLDMLNDGMKGNEIAETLGITKGYVSQIKNRAIREGVIGRNGQ